MSHYILAYPNIAGNLEKIDDVISDAGLADRVTVDQTTEPEKIKVTFESVEDKNQFLKATEGKDMSVSQ